MASLEQYLKKIYYDSSNPTSFAGPDKLYRFVRKDGKSVLSKYTIKKWLQRQEPYSLQRPIKRPVKRNRVVVIGIDDQWDVDLMDMTKFSTYVWPRPLEDKRGEFVMTALKNIFAERRSPRRIKTDKDQECISRLVESLLKQRRIELFFHKTQKVKPTMLKE